MDPNLVSETQMWMASKERRIDLIDTSKTWGSRSFRRRNAPRIRFQDETIRLEIETTIRTSKIEG